MVSEKIRVRIAEIQLCEDNLIHIDILPKAEMVLEDSHEIYDTVMKISDGKLYPLLIDCRSIVSMERDARKRFSNEDVVSAVALLVETPLSKIIGNFFVGLNKTTVPLKLFSSKTNALEWLEEFKP
ncbi:MAG: hypothetical protein JW932_19945 [Deltaproteobacteria bacterium]|nr:hypothetical protein [Deltaproteobacteria bacterium]